MVTHYNMSALNAVRQNRIIGKNVGKSAEKLQSGYRINRSSDDAAALQISEKLRWQIRGLNRGATNVQDGISCVQVAEGALDEVHKMLQRMDELCVQAANDTNTEDDRDAVQQEIDNLAEEITRVGKTTTFNGLFLFDKLRPDSTDTTSITTLVKCSAAETGYLTEAYQDGSVWRPAAFLDFSGIDASNIAKLYDKSFSFTCTENCNEAFKFTMVNGKGDSATDLSGRVMHKYQIDISGMTSGKEIVAKLFDYVGNNPPQNGTSSSSSGGLAVSHSNVMKKLSDDEFVLYARTTSASTEEAAKKVFPAAGRLGMGAVDCGQIVNVTPQTQVNIMEIQSGALAEDSITLEIERMNATILGVDNLSVATHVDASNALTTVQAAIDNVSARRSYFGAMQNRLESVFNRNNNATENLQSSESKMRDTDMADEVVTQGVGQTMMQVSEHLIRENVDRTRDVLQMF